MTLAATLKDSTAQAHRRAESTELQRRMAQGDLDDQYFVNYLAQMFHVHAALERLMAAHPDVAAKINWSADQEHSRRLTLDLEDFGTSVDAQPMVNGTKTLLDTITESVDEDPIALIGLFYVLEGSMNGNRFIVRALRARSGGVRCSFLYLDPYGEEQPARWAAFRVALDSIEITEARGDSVIRSAHAMFDGIAEICDEIMAGDTVHSA